MRPASSSRANRLLRAIVDILAPNAPRNRRKGSRLAPNVAGKGSFGALTKPLFAGEKVPQERRTMRESEVQIGNSGSGCGKDQEFADR